MRSKCPAPEDKKNGKILLHFAKENVVCFTMKPRKLTLLFSAIAASVLMGACSSNDEVADKGFNCLGLVSYTPASFEPSSEYSSVIRTKDIFGCELPSGDRTSFLWGAIVIEDY